MFSELSGLLWSLIRLCGSLITLGIIYRFLVKKIKAIRK